MPVNRYDNYPLTWQPDKSKLKRPIYKSLIEQLEDDILCGILPKDSKLPSQRELADFLDINFTTVGQAYKYGIEIGLLYTAVGSGTFISQNAFNSITISNDEVQPHLIDLGLVSSFEECNYLVVPPLVEVTKNKNTAAYLNYKAPLGTRHQLSIARRWLMTQGVETSPDNIAIVPGVQNALTITLLALFSPGERIAVDRYTYSNFIELATLLSLELVLIDDDESGMRPDLLAIECKKKTIHGIFLMPSCNNPLGFMIPLARRRELADVIVQEKLWLIEDDIHAFMTTHFLGEAVTPFHALIQEQTIYLAGLTKFICSGVRVAYLVFPEKARHAIKHAMFNVNVKTSGIDAVLATRILATPTADIILREKFALTKRANELFDQYFNLPRPSNPYPFFRVIPVDPRADQKQIEQCLLDEGVRVYHSNRFTTQPQPDAFIRVALSSNAMEVLEAGLKIIAHKCEIVNFNQK